jgi:hypothetical protein
LPNISSYRWFAVGLTADVVLVTTVMVGAGEAADHASYDAWSAARVAVVCSASCGC